MKSMRINIKLSDKECQELISWMAERIIQYSDRDVEVWINDIVIISQPKSKDANIDTKVNTDGLHTGYSVDSENLRKEKENGFNKD